MTKAPPPKKRRIPPRNPPAPRAIVERALRLAAQSTPEDAAEQLKKEWKPGERKPPSWRTIRRWQHGENGQAAVAAEVLGTPTPAPSVPIAPPSFEPPPTDNDKKIDELVGRSRTWRRVQEALARALAPYPDAARAVAAELKRIDL